jgi:hypothetical protein
MNPLRPWLIPLLLAVSPLGAQGLDLGLTYARTQVSVRTNESKGPGLQGAVDVGEAGRLRFQVCGGFERLGVAGTYADLGNLGVQCAAWSPAYEVHALLALEARSEHLSSPTEASTYGRLWLQGGLGFRGVIVPLFPFKTFFLARGSDRIVPITRIEYAVPLSTRHPASLTPPT